MILWLRTVFTKKWIKSTLLGLISGIFYPLKGNVNVYTNKLGYVSASPLILNSDIRTNLLYGIEDKDIDDKILLDYLYEFKLFSEEKDFDLNKTVNNKTLSMGQMQKISFIRALVSGVELLVLDESTSNLDIETKNFIFNILSTKNITIINSTHNKEDFQYDHHIKIDVGEERNLFFTK